MNSAGYLHSRDHGWILVEGDIGTVGLTDYVQQEIGTIEHLDLPEIEDTVEAGEPYGSVESCSAVMEIFSPVTGEIMAVNSMLSEHPELINQLPYQDGWIIKVRIDRPEELKELLSREKYGEYLQK